MKVNFLILVEGSYMSFTALKDLSDALIANRSWIT